MKLEVTVDTSKLKQQVDKANKQIEKNLPMIVGKGALKYSATSAKLVPPNRNSNIIPAKFYKRPVYKLIDLLRDKNNEKKKPKKLWAELVKQGYRYVVEGQNKKRRRKLFYYKVASLAKKAAVIVNRGLLRVMYGGNLNVNGESPKTIKKLMDKSPNLKRLVLMLNPISKLDKDKESKITIGNASEVLQSGLSTNWAVRAKKEATYQAKREIKNQSTKVVQKVIENWN